jgi:hypothetical protein
LVTSLCSFDPLPFVTVQRWAGLTGCVNTVTSYASPMLIVEENLNAPFDGICSVSEPLFCNASPEPVRPNTSPPTVIGG